MDQVEFQVIQKVGNEFKVYCYDYKACRKINRLQPQYKTEEGNLYHFKEGEEGIFFVGANYLDRIKKILKASKCLY